MFCWPQRSTPAATRGGRSCSARAGMSRWQGCTRSSTTRNASTRRGRGRPFIHALCAVCLGTKAVCSARTRAKPPRHPFREEAPHLPALPHRCVGSLREPRKGITCWYCGSFQLSKAASPICALSSHWNCCASLANRRADGWWYRPERDSDARPPTPARHLDHLRTTWYYSGTPPPAPEKHYAGAP